MVGTQDDGVTMTANSCPNVRGEISTRCTSRKKQASSSWPESMASGWMNAPTHGITQQRQRKPTQGSLPAPPLPSLPAVLLLVATKAAFDQGLRFRYEALRIRRGLGVLRIPHPSPLRPPRLPHLTHSQLLGPSQDPLIYSY